MFSQIAMFSTAETGSIGSGSDRDDHVSRRRVVSHACCLEVCKTSRLSCKENEHTACAVPAGTNFLRSGKFQKDLILFVVRCYLGALIRGSQNLGAPCKGTDCHFLRCAKSDKPFPLQRTSRFSKPRFSAPKHQIHTNKIKSFKGSSEVLQTSIQPTQTTTTH